MDAVAALLDGPRAQGVFALRTIMSPPWSVRIEDRAPLTLVAIVRGEAWFVPEHGEPTRLDQGDVAIVRGPDHYGFADAPTTAPQAVIHAGQRCTTPEGVDLHEAMHLGVRSWGNDPDGSAMMLVGTYESSNDVSNRLLAALPPVALLRAADWTSPFVPVLADELANDEPGQGAVVDRLVDLLLVAALRAWFARPEADPPAWYAAQRDPVVGKAIGVLQHNPAEPWTVASVAAEVGVSRATLARRFNELVGEPPMSFLTGWRLTLAADLLRSPVRRSPPSPIGSDTAARTR
jgi:hypothetical protein